MLSNLGEQILKRLATSSGGTTLFISRSLRIKESTVGRGLLRLRENGYVTKIDGMWRLTDAGRKLTDGMTFTIDEVSP